MFWVKELPYDDSFIHIEKNKWKKIFLLSSSWMGPEEGCTSLCSSQGSKSAYIFDFVFNTKVKILWCIQFWISSAYWNSIMHLYFINCFVISNIQYICDSNHHINHLMSSSFIHMVLNHSLVSRLFLICAWWFNCRWLTFLVNTITDSTYYMIFLKWEQI